MNGITTHIIQKHSSTTQYTVSYVVLFGAVLDLVMHYQRQGDKSARVNRFA